MQNTLKLAAILFALAQLSSQCGNGCLKCTVPEVCDLCDYSNAFILEDGKCVHKPFVDCLTYNLEGKCLVCKEGLYLNLDQQKCLPIQTYKEIENCLYYTPQGNCSLCDKEFYLNGSVCAPIETEISNCQVYNTKNLCQECSENFILSVDQKNCVSVVEDSKCLGYSLNKCNRCNEQSVVDMTYYKNLIQEKSNELNSMNQQFIFNYFTQERHYYFETCIQKKVSNCAVFQDFKTCLECQQGYYLQDNLCKQNPQNFIPFCNRYENINKCIECQHGYYLESDVSCKAIEPIEHCILYNGSSNTTQCKECEEKFYLQGDNKCVSRTLEVENCVLYTTNNNVCSKCIDGLVLTTDAKKCLKEIENCQQYQSSSIDTVEVQCFVCKEGYYLKNNVCELGDVVNCKVYLTDQNVCQECQNKYYLNSGECKLHGDINNCDLYSQSEAGKCNQCRSGTIKFPKTTACKPIIPIEGCLTYSEPDKCSKCMDGYNYISEKQCDPIAFGTNCQYQNQGVCEKCNKGYFLNTDKLCVLPVSYGLEFCDESEINVNGFLKCNVCKPDSFAYVQNSNYMCRTTDSIKQGWNVQTLTENCQSFKKENNQAVCTLCNEGYYLQDSDKTCQQTCQGTLYRVKKVDNILLKNYCMTTVEDNCKLKSLKQLQDTQNHSCIQCQDNFYAKVDFTNTLQILAQRVDNLMTSKEGNLYYRPQIQCLDNNTPPKVRSFNNQLLNKCEYYYDLHNNEIGCARCQQGYNGLIKNWEVLNCVTYDSNLKQCTKCINTHQLSQNGLECTPLNIIQNCLRYKQDTQDICELCKQNYYLSQPTQCLPVTQIPNCQQYQMDQNKCIRCKEGYRFNQNKDVCFKEISKCQVYSNPNTSDDTAICTTCQDGYYPINQNQQCEIGNIKNCWKYKQNRINECEFYNNNIPFQDQNICTPVQKIEGCQKYSNIDTCQECNSQSHYLSGSTCCPHRYFNTGNKCEQILIANCKTTNSLNTCNQCLDNFYEDIYQQEVNPPHVCCGLGSYWHPNDLECSSRLDVSLNEIGCSLYSDSKLKCVHCKEGYYLSTNRFCCPLGQYHKIENNINTCKTIPDTAPNCIKYNGFNNECTECKAFQSGDEYEYFLGTNSKKCCKKNFEYDTNNGCVTNLTGCKTVNANGTDCDKCRDNFVLEGTKCCAKKDTNQTPQYYNSTSTSCNDVTTNTIDNCEYYKLVNGNVRCSICNDQFVLSNSSQKCCPINTVFVGSNCVNTKFVFDNCSKVNLTTNLCNQCNTGYYLHNGVCVDNGKIFDVSNQEIKDGPTTDCSEYSNTDECNKCKTGYTLQNNKTCLTDMSVIKENKTYTYENLLKGCAYFNFVTSTCTKCKGGYYKNENDIMCCQFGQRLDSNKCENLTDDTCQKVDANNQCTQRSSNTLSNCEKSVDNQSCLECKLGYYLVNGVCKTEQDVNKVCSNFLITSNCKEIDLNNCTCTSCQSWAYGQHCCQNGQKWDTNLERCINISEDVYCAQWNSQTNKCNVCFFDQQLKTISDNYKWVYQDSTNSSVASSGSNAYPDDFNIWNNTETGRCCPLYQGIKDNRCQYSTITNCRKPKYVNNAWQCTECDYGYAKGNSDTTCDSIPCQNNYYESNNKCCPKGQYFNKEDSRCHKLIDKNCLESNESTSCTTACANNYSKKKYMESTLVEMYIPARPQGPAFYMKKYVQLCEEIGDIHTLTNAGYAEKIIKNCQEVDSQNSKCTKCDDNYYLETDAAMCCPNDKALITLIDDNTVQNGYCYNIANLLDDCADYDIETKKCKNCQGTKNLSHGRCCDTNKYFNVNKSVCEFDSTNCALYDEYYGVCKLCNNGYHLSNNVCVTTDKYYDKSSTTAVLVQNKFTNCTKVTQSNKNECLELLSNSNSYLHRGRSCQLGYYNNGEECVSINSLGTEYQNCQELDHTNKCQNCNSNYYYSNGRCCKDQEYFEPFIKKCIPINKYRNCLQASKDKEKNCQVCEQGYYIGAYGFCVQEGQKIIDQYGNIDTIDIDNCTQVSDNNQCIKCTGSKVIYDNTCLDYDNISTLQRIGGCRIIKAGTPPTCLECQDNFYLTKEDEKCCQFGTYFDGADCTSLQLISINCKQYEYGVCNQCQDGFYLSNGQACCQEGQYARTASECANIDLLNCLQSSNNGVCEKCNTGFMLVNGVCKTIENLNNCSIGANNQQCLICNTDYYLNDSGQCIQQDTIEGCQQKTNNKNTCQTCNQGLYYDGYQCCNEGKYTRILGVVKDNNQYQCVDLQPTTLTNCKRIDNKQCVSCGTDQYLFNNQCCPYGQYHDGNNCVESTANGLQNCRVFKDANTCLYYTNEKGEDLSCLNQKYLHLNHCCSIDQYWNSTNNACESTTDITQYKNCKKLNDQMKCIECSSGYLSDGLCCDEGKYNVSGTCTNISVTNCLQYDGTFCSKCDNSKNLSSFNRCCEQNYYFSTDTCNAHLTDQNVFDIFEESLVSCNNSKYPADKLLCCAESEYNNSGSCTALTNASTCSQVYKGGADNTCALCKEKDANNKLYQAFKNTCKDITKFILFFSNDTKTYEADRDSVITNCQQMEKTGLCKKCKSGYNLSEGICLTELLLDISDLDNISTSALVSNCEEGTSTTVCTKCKSNYFKTSDGKACCDDGKITSDASTCSATDADMANCIEFVDHGDNFKSKCKTCKDTYNIYDSKGDQSIFTCCKDGKRPKSDNLTCETFGYNIDKCSKFDHETNKCLQCKPEVDGNKYYLSVNSVCCKEGEMYDTGTSQCTTINNTTYPDCVNVSTVNNASVCSKCSSTTYFTGTGTQICCASGKYNDGTTPCGNITVTNCKQANSADDCLVCNTDYVKLVVNNKGVCCKEGQYYNGTTCVDIPSDKNCHKVPDNATDTTQCAVCKENYLLAEDTKTCCEANDITGTKCVKNQLLYQTDILKLCGKWDRKNMSCTQCQEQGYYASNGGCCQDGKYSKVNNSTFTCINIPATNCQQYDDENGCTKCSSGYLLNKSKSNDNGLACNLQTIANGYTGCTQTDNNFTKCLECQEGFYLHKDKCTPVGQKRNTANNTSENITIDNCLRMKSDSDTECEVCKNEYYLTLTKLNCCKEGTYLLNGQCVEQGGANDPKPIENCAIFKDDPQDCLKCKYGYVKGTKQAGVHICLKFRDIQSDELCEEAYITIQNQMNTFNCTKCKNHQIDYVLKTTKVNRNISYDTIKGCTYYDTQIQLSQSSLTCKVCENNSLNYLDDQGICQQRQVENLNQCIGNMPYDEDKCTDCKVGYYLDNDGVCQQIPILNCMQYNGTQCEVCNEGYKLMLQDNQYNCVDQQTFIDTIAQSPTFFKGYINECKQQTTCVNYYVGGINQRLTRLFSCHICTYKDMIPFVSIRAVSIANNDSQIESIQRYKKSLNGETQDQGEEFEQSQCMKPIADTFNIQNNQFNFPNNCSLGMINSSLQPTAFESNSPLANIQNLGIYCVACKAGYKPFYGQVTHQVYKCESINYCEQQGVNFNECETCQDGYVFKYDPNTKLIQKDSCEVFTNDQNCYAADFTDQNNFVCKFCKRGYSINKAGFCEQTRSSDCLQNKFERLDNNQIIQTNNEELLLRFQNGEGCQQCKDNYVKALETTADYYCEYSPFIKDKIVYQNTQIYQQNCLKYDNTSDHKCVKCLDGSVLNIYGSCLQQNTQLQNCSIAESQDLCQTCDQNFMKLNNLCVIKDIDNCIEYIENTNDNKKRCAKCEIGYGLDNGLCAKDLFNSCIKVDKDNNCQECLYGFHLITLKNNKKQCIEVITHQNCRQFSSSNFQSFSMQCTQCESNQYVLTDISVNEVCNPLPQIKNCMTYDIQNSFDNSTLDCLECKKGYYLFNNECLPRLNPIQNCMQYEIDSQLCKQCENNYYLSNDKKQCVENPRGIQHCKEYKSNTECKLCQTLFYVLEGECKQVTTENVVQMCEVYDSSQKCIQCSPNYLLGANVCESIVASNCLEIDNRTACKTCSFGYQLETVESVTSCVKIEKENIQNCQIISDTKPFACIKCNDGYYVMDGQCEQVEQKIPMCKEYESPYICSKCDNYSILSSDRTTCASLINQNCLEAQEQKEGFCVVCKPGYILQDNKCIFMTGDFEKVAENCMVYQDIAENKKLGCLICQIGYSMNDVGQCSRTKIDGQEPTTPEVPTDQENQDSNLMIYSIINYTLWFFYAFF